MSDTEIDQDLCESDQEVSKHHSKLVGAVAQLDKTQRVKKAERNEPSLEVSEYHLVKSGVTDQDAVRVQDLVKLSGRKGYQNDISKKLGYIQQKNKVLAKPLEKPAAERIKRTVGYDNVKKELTKWDGIVARNRTAERLFFPLKDPSELKDSSNSKVPEFLKRFTTKSDLMKKIEEVDPLLLYPPAEEEKKDDNKYKLTMEELTLKRKETARFRAQQSYKEAKAKRQRKIKSKKFHRIQRKGKIKQQLKEFEELKDSNPEAALAMLEQLDKTRAEERMSLRHKSTGQWAKNKQIRTKYDKETRQVLANQLAIGRELTQKVKRMDDEDYSPNLEFQDPKPKPILDCPLEETTSLENEQEDQDLVNFRKIMNMGEGPASKKPELEIDPEKYVNIKPKHLMTQLPDIMDGGVDSEQEQETQKIMSEAFADDDVVEEFNKEKEEEEMKKSQGEQIDLSLPGWGNWVGTNIKKRKVTRKKKRFILNMPKEPPRRPENQGKVIIFEQENAKLKKHLVSELPYPFTRVTDFEATIRAPISRTFVPMNAHVRLIQPTVNTKLGQVIEPMDENELVKKQPIVKKPLKRRIDKKNKDKKNNDKKNIANEKRRKQNVTTQ